LNSKRCLLLDNRRLVGQLTSLERTSSRQGAKDIIKHPSGSHDDIAAATAGLMVRLVGVEIISFVRSTHLLAVLVARAW